jgi:hypothetical protein
MTVAMLTWVRKSRAADVDRARESGTGQGGRPPVPQLRPLSELDPFDLEVHPSVQAGTAGQLPALPQYVPREHDVRLRQVADPPDAPLICATQPQRSARAGRTRRQTGAPGIAGLRGQRDRRPRMSR